MSPWITARFRSRCISVLFSGGIHTDVANLDGNLWKLNLAKVVLVDVTDDYRLMQPPMPSTYYPVVGEFWLPSHGLTNRLSKDDLVAGYLYDWHERPAQGSSEWYVGVVQAGLAQEPAFESMFADLA